MKRFAAALLLLLLTTLPALAGNEGGSDYAQPFAPALRLGGTDGVNPLATVTVIELTGEDLIARGARTAADALRYTAGCYVYSLDRWPDRGERLLRVRGSAPSDLRVFIDGLPYDHGFYGTVDLANIPADQIALIRIYPGSAPALYGESGGAVVEIITRRAGEQLTARFESRFGDQRSTYFNFGLGDTHKSFQYFVAASRDSASGWLLPASFERTAAENGGARDYSAYARNHYRLRAGAQFSPQAEAHVSVLYSTALRDIPFDINTDTPPYLHVPDQNYLGGVLNFRLGAFGPLSLRGETYLLDLIELRDDYAEPEQENLLLEHRFRNLRAGGGLTALLELHRRHLLMLRLGGRHDEIEFILQDLFHGELIENRTEAALGYALQPLDWLNLTLDGGYARAAIADAVAWDPIDPAQGWLAHAGAAVGPFAGVTVRAAASHSPRFPSLEEWFDRDIGNPELQPAQTVNLETAIRYSPLDRLNFELLGFSRQTQNGLRLEETDETDHPWRLNDDAQYQTSGLTFAFDIAPLPGLFLAANYTYLRTLLDSEEARLIYTPAHSAAAEARYRLDFGLGAAVFSQLTDEVLAVQNGQVVKMSWYLLTGARLFYSYRDRVEVFFQGNNLADVYYENHFGYPEPGRQWEGGIKLTY